MLESIDYTYERDSVCCGQEKITHFRKYRLYIRKW